MRRSTKRLGRLGAAAAVTTAIGGAGYVASNWLRYGRVDATVAPDPLLDRFMPRYEIREQHETRVQAPAAVTYRAARQMSIQRSPLVRAIFRGRELLMRADGEAGPPAAAPLVEQTVALGWRVLAEEPSREIVLGAVTQPWTPNPRFDGVAPEDFAAFTTPAAVKIVWSLSVEPVGRGESIFRTETRVMTTDAAARRRFRRYWAVMSPGIVLIRRESLRLVKRDAERQARIARRGSAPARRRKAVAKRPRRA